MSMQAVIKQADDSFFTVEIPANMESSFQAMVLACQRDYPNDPHVYAADYAIWLLEQTPRPGKRFYINRRDGNSHERI